MLKIELAKQDDREAILPLLAAQFAEHDITLSNEELGEAVAGLLDPTRQRGAVVMARRRGQTVGIAVLAYTWTLEHGGFVAWLDELYVSPRERGRGIGSQLLEVALLTAREAGCRALDLEVDAGHRRVIQLYERHGFSALDRARFAKSLR